MRVERQLGVGHRFVNNAKRWIPFNSPSALTSATDQRGGCEWIKGGQLARWVDEGKYSFILFRVPPSQTRMIEISTWFIKTARLRHRLL